MDAMAEQESTASRRRTTAIRLIICLGVVSLFADMTYEGAHSIIGPYLKDLGATAAQVAMIAGLGEMLAASLRFCTSSPTASRSPNCLRCTGFPLSKCEGH